MPAKFVVRKGTTGKFRFNPLSTNEVTPLNVRLRKVELSAQSRQTAASRKARGLAAV